MANISYEEILSIQRKANIAVIKPPKARASKSPSPRSAKRNVTDTPTKTGITKRSGPTFGSRFTVQ